MIHHHATEGGAASASLTCKSMNWSAIAGTLYGRDDLLEQLSTAYAKSSCRPHQTMVDTRIELVLIAGSSGVGKTALALSLKDRVFEDRGFFLTGKFDQVAATNQLTAKSYGPFVEAVTDYTKQVLAFGSDFAGSLRQALLKAMSHTELQVLIETIPALNTILHFRGQSTTASEQSHRIVLRGVDAEERFLQIFRKFVQTISSQGSPMVLFLDDIQWMSTSALALLRAIAAAEQYTVTSNKLLIICTCRNDDRNDFDQVYGNLQACNNLQVSLLQMSNMAFAALHQMISDLLQLDQPKTLDFAETLFSRTQGNVLHLLQLLKTIERNSSWDESLGTYVADESDGILVEAATIQQLLDMRVNRLPDSVKSVLKVAACLGCVFSEACLVAGVFLSAADVLAAIEISQEEGIIVVGSDPHTFRFPHDKFQQASYLLIPDESKNAFHLSVGQRLWHWLPKELHDENLLLVADQVSWGIGLINDKEDRGELATLFLKAGNKASTASSFSAAALYYKCGIELLDTKCWENQYNLTLALYNAAVQIEYYCGDSTRVEELITEITNCAVTFDDTLVARFTTIYSLGSRGEMIRALDESLEVLKCLGEPFPTSLGRFRATLEVTKCKWMLKGRSEQAILQSPTLTDKKKLTAMRLMVIMHTFAFTAGVKYWPAIAARVVQMSLEFGTHEPSYAGFALLAFVYATQGDADESYRCGSVALRIMNRYQSREWQARLAFSLYGFAFPLKNPLRDSIEHLREGHQVGLVVGDLHFSMLCAFALCWIKLYAGNPIPDVLDSASLYWRLGLQYKQHFLTKHFQVLRQLCFNLLGKSDNATVLSGEAVNEEEVVATWETAYPAAFNVFVCCKHFLAVYMNEHQRAEYWATKIRQSKVDVWPFALVTRHFFQSLASANSSRTQALHHLSKLRLSSSHCPTNYSHKVFLVEAELAKVAGNKVEAIEKYQKAINGAAEQHFLQERALACERAAYAFRDWGNHDESAYYMSQAMSGYELWGAQVKVNQLRFELSTVIVQAETLCAT